MFIFIAELITLLLHYNLLMISLNAEIGASPLVSHKPISLYVHSSLRFTAGESGEVVAWLPDDSPLFQMSPSLNGDADQLLAIVYVRMKQIDEQHDSPVLVTVHMDNRLRLWSATDGTCLGISAHALFPQNVIALLAPMQTDTKFVFALTEQCLHVVDLWSLRIVGNIDPRTDSFSLLRKGHITERLDAELLDNSGKKYRLRLQRLFEESMIDLGAYLNSFEKKTLEIEAICQKIAKEKPEQSYEPWPEDPPNQHLQILQKATCRIQQQSLANQIISDSSQATVPELCGMLNNETPLISSLECLFGHQLYYFIGFLSGTVYAIPCVTVKNEPLLVITLQRHSKSPAKFMNFSEGLLFVSWQDGRLGVYDFSGAESYLRRQKQAKCSDQQEIARLYLVDARVLLAFEQTISSFIKSKLCILDSHQQEHWPHLHAFKLAHNEVALFDSSIPNIRHYRGLPQQLQIYALCVMDDFIGICSSRGVDLFSPDSHERTISYSQWEWRDYYTCEQLDDTYDYNYKFQSGNSLIKFNCRSLADQIDYCKKSPALSGETFGRVDLNELPNDSFPKIIFLRQKIIQKTAHFRTKATTILKIKRNSVRRDYWENTGFVLHGNLSAQIEHVTTTRLSLIEAISQDFAFFSLFSWDQSDVPYLSHLYSSSQQQFILKRRLAAQGVGKTFTTYFQPDAIMKLSERLINREAVASIALFQACARDISLTEWTVEAVQFYSNESRRLFDEKGAQTIAKLAVSGSQYIVKAGVNLLISRIVSGRINLHPIFEYFILNLKVMEESRRKLLSYIETVWLVYVGLGVIHAPKETSPQHPKVVVTRILEAIDFANFQAKPEYLIVVMKILNEGLHRWSTIISSQSISTVLTELFRVFFCYDGFANVGLEDKKFNYCFSQLKPAQTKLMKQTIVRTLIYISKEFPHEFHSVLKEQSCNQKVHVWYPASTLELFRQFIKSQKPDTHIVFYVELLLQCLSPINPGLRKYVQKSALNALHLMCFSYPTISFNQPSQKLSVLTLNHLYIYCLRTSTKWRTIVLKDPAPLSRSIVEMSPKGTYIALLSSKLRVWRLSSGFWSGVLGAFSQEWSFDAEGTALKWEENEEALVVANGQGNSAKRYSL